MIRSLVVTFFLSLLPYYLTASEPSAFGAGDLNNPNPYGLTSSEEVLLENKNNLRKVVVKSNMQANEVDSIKDKIEGLQGIIDGVSRKSRQNTINLQKLSEKNEQDLKSSDEYQKRVSALIQANTDATTQNTQNIEKIKFVVSELSALIDTINTTYVTKNEYNALVVDINNFKELVVKELKGGSSLSSDLKGMKSSDISQEAFAHYKKKDYDKAIEYYKVLIEKNYKPAKAHYMIGESYYFTKRYADAIAYFKKSASLYSKASYMPYLMLHTAVSMDKTGDDKNARSFYNVVIQKYPDTRYSKSAKKYLDAMK